MTKSNEQLGIAHLIFYLCVSSIYVYAFIFDTELFRGGKYKKVGFPFDDSFNGRMKFLTYINMGLQTIFFTLSASCALFGITNDLMGSQFVSIAFWSLYVIDRKLIFPVILDSIMPSWLN